MREWPRSDFGDRKSGRAANLCWLDPRNSADELLPGYDELRLPEGTPPAGESNKLALP